MARPVTLADALERGDQVAATVDRLLKRQPHSGHTRVGLVLVYLSIVAEHQLGFLLLVRSDYRGSALVLLRAQTEALVRMLWITRCIPDAQLENIIGNKNYEFPTFLEMAEAVDRANRTGGFFSNLKRRTWKDLCDFAHGGLRQIHRRFKGRTIEPNYPPQGALAATNLVNISVLLAAGGFFEFMGYDYELTEIKDMMHDYDLTGT